MQLDRNKEPVISVDPLRCRVWRLHERSAQAIDVDSCKDMIESFRQHGQLLPALARRVCGDPDHDLELIYGARRLFIARHLNIQLLVEVCELSDRDALAAMDIENRLRQDISTYERGLGYSRWLRSGHFKSQEDIAQTLNVSASQVSRLLRLARLPAAVVDAFRSAVDIRENWGLELMDALEDPARRSAILNAARACSRDEPRRPAREVYRKLLTASVRGRKPREQVHDRIVLAENGEALFRVRRQTNAIALILPVDALSSADLLRLQAQLTAILEDVRFSQPAGAGRAPIASFGISPGAQLELGVGAR